MVLGRRPRSRLQRVAFQFGACIYTSVCGFQFNPPIRPGIVGFNDRRRAPSAPAPNDKHHLVWYSWPCQGVSEVNLPAVLQVKVVQELERLYYQGTAGLVVPNVGMSLGTEQENFINSRTDTGRKTNKK